MSIIALANRRSLSTLAGSVQNCINHSSPAMFGIRFQWSPFQSTIAAMLAPIGRITEKLWLRRLHQLDHQSARLLVSR